MRALAAQNRLQCLLSVIKLTDFELCSKLKSAAMDFQLVR